MADIITVTLTVTGDIVIRAYEKVGIRKDEKGCYPSFRGLTYDDMPTFSTFNECLQERILEIKNDPSGRKELDLLMDLSFKIRRILTEWKVYFDGQTKVKVNPDGSQIISFGTEENAVAFIRRNKEWKEQHSAPDAFQK